MHKSIVVPQDTKRLADELAVLVRERYDAGHSNPAFVPPERMIERMSYFIELGFDHEDEHLHEPGTIVIGGLRTALYAQRAFDRHEYRITIEYINSIATQALAEYNSFIKLLQRGEEHATT